MHIFPTKLDLAKKLQFESLKAVEVGDVCPPHNKWGLVKLETSGAPGGQG